VPEYLFAGNTAVCEGSLKTGYEEFSNPAGNPAVYRQNDIYRVTLASGKIKKVENQ